MIIYLLATILATSLAYGADYYVDPDVSAGGAGSQASPWNTTTGKWGTINAALASGDVTIHFSALEAAGTSPEVYASYISVERTDTGPRTLTLEGHSLYNTNDATPAWVANPTPIATAYRGSRVARVTGSGSLALGWSRGSTNPRQDRVTMRGFEVTGAGARMGFAGDDTVVEWIWMHDVTGLGPGMSLLYPYPDNPSATAADRLFDPVTGVTIQDCWLENIYGEAIYLGSINPDIPVSLQISDGNQHSDVSVLRTTVINPGYGGGQGDAIDCKNGITRLTIEDCDLSGWNGMAAIILPQTMSNVDQQAIIRGNYIHDGDASGEERYGIYGVSSANKYGYKGVRIEQNIINSPTAGIYFTGAATAAENIVVDNNFIRDCRSNGIVMISMDAGGICSDNLVLGNTPSGVSLSGQVTPSGNYYDGTYGSSSGGTQLSSADATTARAQTYWLTAGVTTTTTTPPVPPTLTQPIFDTIVVSTSTDTQWTAATMPSWFRLHPPSSYAVRVVASGIDANKTATAADQAKQRNVGLVYITDDNDGLPYDEVPTAWSTLTSEAPKLGETMAYRVRVRATAPTTSAWSNTLSLTTTTDGTPPATPSAPTLTGVSTGQTTTRLDWTNVGATAYELQRDAVTINTGAGLSYNDSGLSASTTYSYRVRATAPVASAYSATVNVTTESAPPPPPPPAGYRFTVPDSYAGASNGARLQAAFSDSRLNPGDRVLIRNGSYVGQFDVTVRGTQSQPIWYVAESPWGVRVYNAGERSSGAPHPTILISHWRTPTLAQGVGLAGLEIYCTNTDRNNEGPISPDPAGSYMPVPIGIASYGHYVKVVHCYVHDSRQGIVSQTPNTLYPEFYGNILTANGWANYEYHIGHLQDRLWQGPNFYLQHGGWFNGQFLGLDPPGAIVEMNILQRSGYWMSGQFYGSSAASAENVWWQRNIAIGDPTEAAGSGYIGVLPMEHMVGGLGEARLRLGRVLNNVGWNSVLTVGYGSADRNANARIEDNYAYVATGDTYPDLRYKGGIHANKISSASFAAITGSPPNSIDRLAFNPETDQPATFLRNTIIRRGTTSNDPTVRMLNHSSGQANWQSGGNTFIGNLRFEFDGGSPTGAGGESVWRQVMRDQTSTFTATLPTSDRTFVFPSKYSFWGPMLYVANVDWDGNNSCTFNPSSYGFSSGSYKVYNAQDMTAGGAVLAPVAPVATGTYSSGNLVVSSAGWTRSQMNNPDPRIANPYSYAADGSIRFNVFILTR